jgi:hypothetical protein
MLMLFVTLMVIAAGVAAPTMAFRVRRDREEEIPGAGGEESGAVQLGLHRARRGGQEQERGRGCAGKAPPMAWVPEHRVLRVKDCGSGSGEPGPGSPV